MVKLSDMRRRFPVADRAAYDVAYAEAEVAGRLGDLVHRSRVAAGLSGAELAARTGTTEDAITLAEEGSVAFDIGFLDRLARALGVTGALSLGTEQITFGAPVAPDRPRPGD